jgi:hypothetical protein
MVPITNMMDSHSHRGSRHGTFQLRHFDVGRCLAKRRVAQMEPQPDNTAV